MIKAKFYIKKTTQDNKMIWLIGNLGMLGQDLAQQLKELNLPFIGSDREISILDPEALNAFADEHKPSWIINCAAYTAVDKAEEDVAAAYAINQTGVANIARLAAERDIPLIHISTDYVFDGTSSTPLSEDAPTGPQGVYGASKLAGEEEIRKICSKYFILRTAWLYGQYGPNCVSTMLKLMNKLDSLKVVDDQKGSPTWTRDLTGLIGTILKTSSEAYGTYHLSGEGECTWFDFASRIYSLGKEFNLISSECVLNPCTSDEFLSPAKRPAYSLMSKEKVKKVFSYAVPRWEDSLQTFMDYYADLFGRVSNWMEHAEYDLETAEAMQQSGRFLYVLITCQQSIEKMMKAVYEFRELEVPRIHDLFRLSEKQKLFQPGEYDTLLKDLSYYYIASRYGERVSTLSKDITKSKALDYIEKTREVMVCMKSRIHFV
jgi:dTDP-4-dehydrorhamnose reductase